MMTMTGDALMKMVVMDLLPVGWNEDQRTVTICWNIYLGFRSTVDIPLPQVPTGLMWITLTHDFWGAVGLCKTYVSVPYQSSKDLTGLEGPTPDSSFSLFSFYPSE